MALSDTVCKATEIGPVATDSPCNLLCLHAGVALQRRQYAREAAVLEGDRHAEAASCSKHLSPSTAASARCQAQHEAQVQVSAVPDGRGRPDLVRLPCLLLIVPPPEVPTASFAALTAYQACFFSYIIYTIGLTSFLTRCESA